MASHAAVVYRESPWICRHSLIFGVVFGAITFLALWLAGYSNFPYMLIPGVLAYIVLTYVDHVWPEPES